jgi:hypothetical protein
VASLKGRRFFFATAKDLRAGALAVEAAVPVEYLLQEMRDDRGLTVFTSLLDAPEFGQSPRGDVSGSPQYFIFRRGLLGRSGVPRLRSIPQRRGGTKYAVDPTRHCLIVRCGGLHADTGALVAGELQLPLDPSRTATRLFRLYSEHLLRGFSRVGLYWLGPEALGGFHGGQRLVTISVRSPREYDLTDSSQAQGDA